MHMMTRMPWPEDSLTEDETIVTKFRQHWKLLLIPFGWFVLAIIAIALAGWIMPSGALTWIPVVLVVGAAMWLIVRPVVDWFVTYYVLTTERLITRTGLIARSGIEIPLENITNVNFSQGIWERILAAGDVIIESAGTSGTSRFKNIPRPDEFQTLLYKIRDDRTTALQRRAYSPPPAQETAQTSAPPASAPTVDPADQLAKLKDLHDKRIISDAEYEEKRQKLLDQI